MTIIVLNPTTKEPLDPQRAPVDGDLVEETMPGGMKKRYTYLGLLEPQPIPIRIISVRSFLNRFTLPERIALRTMVSMDPIVEDLFESLKLAAFIDLDDPLIPPGLGYIAGLSQPPDPVIAQPVISPTRIAELLADGEEYEEYTGFR
jgi:hypothetical protein